MPVITEKEIKALRSKVEKAKLATAKASGRRDEIAKQLKSEYGLTTLGAAKKHLAQLNKDCESIGRRFTKALDSFEDQWEERVNGE